MSATSGAPRRRARVLGIDVGVLPPGSRDAITDVAGVRVGHRTLWQGDAVRTGVTVVLPHGGNLYQEKVPAGVCLGNAFGKPAGLAQIEELGTLETPIALTNTLSVGPAVRALVHHTLEQRGNADVRSVNAVVGETNDGFLNDIRGQHVTASDVRAALAAAATGPVEEGAIGAGTGTVCFGYKGGIGTASRRLPEDMSGYVVGVLVQSNYGGLLRINGAPVGRELGTVWPREAPEAAGDAGAPGDGSCVVIVATDAPLSSRNLRRLARRALFGLVRTGSFMSNGSGEYALAFSTAYLVSHEGPRERAPVALVSNAAMTPFFVAAVEATEEAVYNSLFAATTVRGRDGNVAEALPLSRVLEICRAYRVLDLQTRLPGLT